MDAEQAEEWRRRIGAWRRFRLRGERRRLSPWIIRPQRGGRNGAKLRKIRLEERSAPEGPAGDITRGWGRLFLVYGVPWIAMQLVGNLSNSTLAVAGTWAAGFAVMGTACVVNALRCGRVHCWFSGPWFLLAAAVTVLRYVEVVEIAWSTIVNAGLAGALLLFFVSENIWGKYFGEKKT